MYEPVLIVHNALRWVVLLLVAYAFFRSFRGWMGSRQYGLSDGASARFATIAVDVQFTIGLLLYVVWSPQVKTAMQDFGAAMKNAELRYFAVEHALTMVLAVAFVHIGRVLARKAKSDAGRHRRQAVWFGLGLLLMIARTPWPGMAIERSWLRM